MTESKKSLLVLISTLSLNREQVQRQLRATTVMIANKISYTTLDGADPLHKERYVYRTVLSIAYTSLVERFKAGVLPMNAKILTTLLPLPLRYRYVLPHSTDETNSFE